MSYIVPMEKPKYCNKCPFGFLKYSDPFTAYKYGYICNIEHHFKGRYESVIEGNLDEDLPRPSWCGLKEVE